MSNMPKEAVTVPESLDVFQASLDGVWNNLGSWKVFLLSGPSQIKPFCGSKGYPV